MSAEHYLRLGDAELLAQCERRGLRIGGPGGQKRNKTESGVRLLHKATGIHVQAHRGRSQHRNQIIALRRLRQVVVTSCREPVDLGRYEVPKELGQLLLGRRGAVDRTVELLALKQLLDLFAECAGSTRQTAQHLGSGSARIARLLLSRDWLRPTVSAIRRSNDLPPLR